MTKKILLLVYLIIGLSSFGQTLILSEVRRTKKLKKDLCLYVYDFREKQFCDSVTTILKQKGGNYKTILIDYPSRHLDTLDLSLFPNVTELILYHDDLDILDRVPKNIAQLKHLKKIICINVVCGDPVAYKIINKTLNIKCLKGSAKQQNFHIRIKFFNTWDHSFLKMIFARVRTDKYLKKAGWQGWASN